MTATILLGLRLLLVIALYTFLGAALYLIWQDLRVNKALLTQGRTPSIQIQVQTPNDLHDQIFHLPEITIGRDPASTCKLKSETVSAQHARLNHHHRQWWLEDLDSRNGTLLNGVLIAEPTVVTTGDKIRCGDVLLTIGQIDRL